MDQVLHHHDGEPVGRAGQKSIGAAFAAHTRALRLAQVGVLHRDKRLGMGGDVGRSVLDRLAGSTGTGAYRPQSANDRLAALAAALVVTVCLMVVQVPWPSSAVRSAPTTPLPPSRQSAASSLTWP